MNIKLIKKSNDPYESYGIDSETGVWQGLYHQCCRCMEWVGEWNLGVAGVDAKGRYHCVWCVRENRAPQTEYDRMNPVALNVPPMFVNASLADMPAAVQRQLRLWPSKPNMAVSGCTGSGRTSVCWALAKLLAQRGYVPVVLDAVKAQDAWQGAFPSKRDEIKNTWIGIPFLFFDNLTSCIASPEWARCIKNVLDVRTQFKRPTVITTGTERYDEPERDSLAQVYGNELHSQLFIFDWVKLPRKDWRREQRKQMAVAL